MPRSTLVDAVRDTPLFGTVIPLTPLQLRNAFTDEIVRYEPGTDLAGVARNGRSLFSSQVYGRKSRTDGAFPEVLLDGIFTTCN